MRTLVFIAIAGCAFGQRGASGAHGLNPVGQGNVLHPGIPMSGPPRIAPRLNGVGGHRSGVVYVPYGYGFDPFYAGYGAGSGYAAGYDPSYGQGYGYGPNSGYAQPQSPTVVINQNYQPEPVHPMLHDYTNTPLPPSGAVGPGQAAGQVPALRDDEPTIFLIAMKDHTIYPVIAYWVDKDTLNYVTVETTVKRVPMAQVDRDLSKQLNDQRNVEFKLPTSTPAPAPAH
jgi:hypothetical protein